MSGAAPTVSIQRWLESEVMGRGLCPPLVKLAAGYRSDDGKLDWARLGALVRIEDHSAHRPGTEQLLDVISGAYLDFMVDAMKGNAPYTHIFILPLFPSNTAFDAFMATVKAMALWSLTKDPDGREFAEHSWEHWVLGQGARDDEIAAIRARPDAAQFIAKQVVEGLFNPIQFYGRRATDADFADVPDTRGPGIRYTILSRAPHYLVQVIDPIRGNALTGNLNRPAVHRRNTELALSTDQDAFERMIAGFLR